MMRWLLMISVSLRKALHSMKGYNVSVPGEANGTAAALMLKTVRPKAATERHSIMSMGASRDSKVV